MTPRNGKYRPRKERKKARVSSDKAYARIGISPLSLCICGDARNQHGRAPSHPHTNTAVLMCRACGACKGFQRERRKVWR